MVWIAKNSAKCCSFRLQVGHVRNLNSGVFGFSDAHLQRKQKYNALSPWHLIRSYAKYGLRYTSHLTIYWIITFSILCKNTLLNDMYCTVLILYYAQPYCTLYYYTDTRQYRGLWFILFTPHSICTISTLSLTLSTLSRIYSNYSIYSPTLLYSTIPTRLYSLLSTVYSILHTLYSVLYTLPDSTLVHSTLLYFTLLYFTIWYCTVLYRTVSYCTVLYRILPYHTCTAVRICMHLSTL